MEPAKQREIASKGGRAAHAKGTAHEFTSDEARVAGRKGGEAVSRDRQHMSAIGREGGHSRGRTRQDQGADVVQSTGGLQSDRGLSRGVEAGGERPSYIGQERSSERPAGQDRTGISSRTER